MTIIAHRGYSARHPEATRAAYAAAIAWAARTDTELWLECDVHFSADDQLICLHDLTIDRTSTRAGRAADLTVAQLKEIDFGSRRIANPTREQRELVTLAELLVMVRDARAAGVRVGLVIETKHPNPRGTAVEDRVAQMLTGYGWHTLGAPVRLISFAVEGVQRFGELVPALPRTLLLRGEFGRWRDGDLPDGVRVAGPGLRLLASDPGYVARVRAKGHQVHAWTVNTPDDVRRCRDLGITGFTTDDPPGVARVLAELAA